MPRGEAGTDQNHPQGRSALRNGQLAMGNEQLAVRAADPAVCASSDSFLQSAMWGLFKSQFDWNHRAFFVDWDGKGERPLLVLCRIIAPGLGCAYIPWGPELPTGFPESNRLQALDGLAQKIKNLLPRNTVFIRFDLPWYAEETAEPPAAAAQPGLPFRRASADIQPPDTVLIDLSPPPDEILGSMKQKWRYNIRLAEKRGVVVTEAGPPGIDVFYRLLEETGKRDGIAIHSYSYYRILFDICNADSTLPLPGPRTQLKVYIASHEGDALAAIVVLFRGTQATYLYGASSNSKRNLMAPYALQWKAMQDAQSLGCLVYDLFGIPPTADPGHPMAGLYLFKTGFGGKIIHRPGSWDYPCRPFLYSLFSAVERLRKKLRDLKKR